MDSTEHRSAEQLLQRYHRRNTALHVTNASIFHFGFTFIQPAFIVVAYLKHFTDSGIILNFPVFVMNFALGIGPLLASMIHLRARGRKRAFVVTSIIQRLMLIPMIIVVGVPRSSATASIVVFLLSYSAYNLAWGFSYYYWQELLSRTLDPVRRTSALGIRDAATKVIDIGASLVSVYVLRSFPFPTSYVVCFIITLISLSVSLGFVAPMREVSVGTDREEKLRDRLRAVLSLPHDDPVFRWFVVFVMLSSGMLFIGGLYTSVTIDRFGADYGGDSLVGIVRVIGGLSGIIAAVVMGRVTDRFGRFWGFLPGVVASVLAPVVAMLAGQSFALQMLVFALRGIGATRWYLEISTTLSFAPAEQHHKYIAYVGIARLLPVLLYTNAGGVIAQLVSPEATFAVTALFGLASGFVLVFVLKPRWDAVRRGTS